MHSQPLQMRVRPVGSVVKILGQKWDHCVQEFWKGTENSI